MDVYVQGRKVRLTQAEFKAQGGQGAVYVKDGTAYKVYADPALGGDCRLLRDGPQALLARGGVLSGFALR